MSLHTLCCQGPHKPSIRAPFMLKSHWGRAATGKKKNLASICAGSLWSYPTLCDPVDCGLPGFSARGVLQAGILECTGQYWLPYSSRALYFLVLQSQTPLSTWCCQNPCNASSCITSTPGPHTGKPKSSRAALRSKPQWTTHMQRWK